MKLFSSRSVKGSKTIRDDFRKTCFCFLTALVPAVMLAIPLHASAGVVHLEATIDGGQANAGAGTGSPGLGMASMTYDDVSGLFSWNIVWAGLIGTETVAHFHGPAAPGVNAGVQVSIDASSPSIGSATITAPQADDLLAGLWYINIHTDVQPGGEIRGQVQIADNDMCEDSSGPLAVGSVTSGSTIGATLETPPVPFCGTSVTAPGVWYTVIGTGNTMTASTCNDGNPATGGAGYDTKISVYCADCEVNECIGGQDDGAGCDGFTTNFAWPTQAGATYNVLVHGFGGATGDFDLAILDDGVPSTGGNGCGIEDFEDFSKEIVSGNDYDGLNGIDLAVEVGIEAQSQYDFKINYNQPDLPPVQIEDTVPAEWQVIGFVDDSLNCEFAGANKKGNGKSATKIVCLPDSTEGMVTVQVDARCHGSRNNKKCRPTSCGALYLNNGAAAYELDPDTNEPVLDDEGNRLPPLLETNELCLVAVSDLNGGGIDYSGNGDEDGDDLPDYLEACDFGTDPCDSDSDDDGVSDYSDDCPLEGPADPALGEILGVDGCIGQSQCSDLLDNDLDGNTDFPADASCEDIIDDSEDTIDQPCPCWVEADLQSVTVENNLDELSCSTASLYPFAALIQNDGSSPEVEGGFLADPEASLCATRDFAPFAEGITVTAEEAGACLDQVVTRCAAIGDPITPD